MAFRYYSAERIRDKMPTYKGTDEELQDAIDDISLLYGSALKELDTKLDIISDDFDKKHSYMPIHHVQKRLKSFDSLIDKAERYGIEDPINNLDTVLAEVLDIGGIRVICNYEEDIYTMSGLLLEQSDIELIRIKDYCKNPKESGYRSLHVVVAIPVYLVNRKAMVPLEIQFRSIAMDTWASLEHELRYKNKGVLNEEIQDQLAECARQLAQIDEKMSHIRHQVLKSDNEYADY
ncbi:MAG: GTP pyrophosphokinase family protein [Clostridiales bacterium]|nr:GTP pyrophosphokinase family protein [Candidatus Crickella merdequi]